jgi:predicted transposase YbfD/YdcC
LCTSRCADDCYDSSERRRGRRERRIVSVWDVPADDDPLAFDSEWVGLKRIIRIERLRQPSTTQSVPAGWETHYYVTSRQDDGAYELSGMIRGHWHIENRLHWVKDVQQHEDGCGIRKGHGPVNMSLLKTWVLSFFRINNHASIKAATIFFANKIADLMALLST